MQAACIFGSRKFKIECSRQCLKAHQRAQRVGDKAEREGDPLSVQLGNSSGSLLKSVGTHTKTPTVANVRETRDQGVARS